MIIRYCHEVFVTRTALGARPESGDAAAFCDST